MRAKEGAFLICSAASLFMLTGCAGGRPNLNADKTVGKAAQAAATEDTPAASQAAAQSANTTTDEEERRSPSKDGREPPPLATPAEPPLNKPAANRVTALKPPTVLPAVMPEVVLSGAHADDCFIGVGDKFAEFRLPDVAGRAQTLADVQGEDLTVMVFWSSDRLAANDQLRYLDEHIARYADLGVKAVAINVADSPEAVRKAVERLELIVPVLLDFDGRLFSRVGKNHLPRTYLLDHKGRVLWFDIEFSRHTRQQLEQAIHASLRST